MRAAILRKFSGDLSIEKTPDPTCPEDNVVLEMLACGAALGVEAKVKAGEVDAAEAIREITGGGAHVLIEALGTAQTTNASVDWLEILGRHVQVGIPAADEMMPVNVRAMKGPTAPGTKVIVDFAA